MSLLQSILCCDAPKRVQIQAMKCFGCWCDFTYNAEHIEPLAERMFAAMRDHELLESSSHALVNVFNHRDLHRYYLLAFCIHWITVIIVTLAFICSSIPDCFVCVVLGCYFGTIYSMF